MMSLRDLFAIMPNVTRVSIFDEDVCDTVYEGDILHCCGGFVDREISWIRLGSNELIIRIEALGDD